MVVYFSSFMYVKNNFVSRLFFNVLKKVNYTL